MSVEPANVTANFRERVQRLALFDPLFRLENKRGLDRSQRPIDYFSLGLMALLFFFECMLQRRSQAGVKELAAFFSRINQGELDLDAAGYEKLARDIIEIFRPPSGKRNSRSFYNWSSRREETVYYSILKADKFDVAANTQYYSLDEQGLELVFATREYFSEFQISINQLLLRKQLERGQFWGALRQIDEMRVAVGNLSERITRIRHEIQRNIVSDSTYQRYRETIEDIHLRLNREDREFEELQAFVRATRERLYYERNTARDRQAYELILRIDLELGEVHHSHGLLLRESIELKTTALQSVQESLYYAGVDSFNFQKEICERLLSTPLPLEAARCLVEPFLFLEGRQDWSGLSVFAGQRVEQKGSPGRSAGFPELLDEEELGRERKARAEGYGRVMEAILEALGERENIDLREFTDYCRREGREALLEDRTVYDLWILLHHRSPFYPEQQEEESGEGLLGEVARLLKERGLFAAVVEKADELEATRRYVIKNMDLKLEVINHVV